LDDWALCLADANVDPAAIVVICLPVDLIVAAVIESAEVTSAGVLITDAGSVKQSIQEGVLRSDAAATKFVGAHPIAGSEQNGFEHADPELFVDRPCIVTSSAAGADREQRCQKFWLDLGANVSSLNPQEHDRILALTSHLPHVMAAVTASCTEPADLSFVGTGFRDSTRVAAGDSGLWQQILCSNKLPVLNAIGKAEAALAELSAALHEDDHDSVAAILDRAAQLRRSLEES
jgi:prephenate dehydrogenase